MHDIVIVGGGLVGSSLAIALDGSGLRVALVEAALPQVAAQPSYDERNLALARASINALGALGVWAKRRAGTGADHVSIHISRRGAFRIRAAGRRRTWPCPSLVRYCRPASWAMPCCIALDACRDLDRIAPAQLIAIESQDDAIGLGVLADGTQRQLRARLLVGADGTESFVRNHFAIGADRFDYAQSALVTTLTCERAPDGCAFERFTDSGPVALLPLAGNRAGLVLSVPTADAARVAELDDDAFIALVHERFGYRLGRFSRPGKRKPYPLARMLASALTAPRMVLVGNAAQTVHPLGAQGFNLGLRDALSLSELLIESRRDAGDPGAADLLARHVARRTPDRQATTAFSHDLVRLTRNPFPPLRWLGSLALGALDHLPPLKRRVALRGMGFRGDVSRLGLSP
jgi:2-octaprenyl-6-methoxyphenol hydroxylase